MVTSAMLTWRTVVLTRGMLTSSKKKFPFFFRYLPQPISFSYEVQWRHLDSRWIRLRARNFMVFFLKILDFICKKKGKRPIKIILKYSSDVYLYIFHILTPMAANYI